MPLEKFRMFLPARTDLLVTGVVILLYLGACAGGNSETRDVSIQSATEAATATAPTAASPAIVATATTATPASDGIHFKSSQVEQGGVTVVYLYEQATSATATFNGKQYPMLRDGSRWWAILGVAAAQTPGLYPVSIAYITERGSPTSVVASLAVVDKEYPVEYIELEPDTAALLEDDIVQAELNQRAAIYAGYTIQRLWSGPFLRPSDAALSGDYGAGRSYNGGPVTDYHRGTDFSGDLGDPVTAAAAGRVVFAGEMRVRGKAVIIDHGAGVFTAYHHLSAIEAQEGQAVAPGTRIGAVGFTGLATGAHLHWEVVIRGVEVEGLAWLQGIEIGP